jgi:hypothetical protein
MPPGAVRGAQAGAVRSRGVVELVDVDRVAGAGVAIGDGESPAAEDDLGLDFGEDVARVGSSTADFGSVQEGPPRPG